MTPACRAAPLALILALAGCATPQPGWLGLPRHDVTAGGIRMAVYLRGDEAQVIRLDRARRADRSRVRAAMLEAASRASGCTAVPGSLRPQGGTDSAVALVALDCPQG